MKVVYDKIFGLKNSTDTFSSTKNCNQLPHWALTIATALCDDSSGNLSKFMYFIMSCDRKELIEIP